MYDALTGRFTFPCPARGEKRVTLSAFRQLERLPRAPHPGGGVALELLLLPGGAAATRVPVGLLPARSRGRVARSRCPVPRVSEDLGQPRLARARRPALP